MLLTFRSTLVGGSSLVLHQGTKRDTVMAASRSIIVDTLPISKQQTGSAWGECLLGQRLRRADFSKLAEWPLLVISLATPSDL